MMVALVTKPEKKDNVLITYHRQCGHKNSRTIHLMCKTGILPLVKERWDHNNNVYKKCLKGKMTMTTILKLSNTRTRKLGKLVHNDLCRPMRTLSIEGNLYIVTYPDVKTE